MNENIFHERLFDAELCNTLSSSSILLSNELSNRYSKWMSTWEDKTYMKFAESSPSTQLYELYNVFLCPAPGFAKLYELVVNRFKEKHSNYKDYAIGGWVNVCNEGGFLDWHFHGSDPTKHDGRWHGYVCVNAEPSKTLYKDIITDKHIQTIENKNGWIVLNPAGIAHRTTPWEDNTTPRITIAFDFSLRDQLDPLLLNKWIPII